MSQSDPAFHADPKTSPDHELNRHELTPMETFFDHLFNQHMVAPQPPEDALAIKGVDEHGLVQHDHGREPD